MAQVDIRELLEAGVHFGHQTGRWNPRMRRFIVGERGGNHIIDLQQTERLLATAQEFAADIAGRGGTVLFVGTKKQARDAVREAALAAGMPYVNQRWLGGLLTNFQTISNRIKRLHDLTNWTENGTLDLLPTRERIAATAELGKLEMNLGGVRDMQRVPDAVFVVDLKSEMIAVREAERLRIPIIGLVDSNCDPTPVSFVIPGNDDAIRSCKVIVDAIGGVVQERATRFRAEEEAARQEAAEQARREAEAQAKREAEAQARKEAEEARQTIEAVEARNAAGEGAADPAKVEARPEAGPDPAARAKAAAEAGKAGDPPPRPRGAEGADAKAGEQIPEASEPTQEAAT